MSLLLTQVVLGLQRGMTLMLVASGLTLTLGALRVINLAHGVTFTIGAYSAAFVTVNHDQFWLGVLLGTAIGVMFGLVVEFVLIRRIYYRDHLDQVLVTFGLLMAVDQAIELIVGRISADENTARTLSIAYQPPFGTSTSWIDGVSWYRLFIVLASTLVLVLLWLMLHHSAIGMRVRAGSEDREMAFLLGLRLQRLFPFVFAVGAGLAGLAGGLQGVVDNATPGVGDNYLVLSFVVVVVGGLGSLKGTVVAALFVGTVQTLSSTYLDDVAGLVLDQATASRLGGALGSAAVYLLMIAVLAIRPRGLYGGAVR